MRVLQKVRQQMVRLEKLQSNAYEILTDRGQLGIVYYLSDVDFQIEFLDVVYSKEISEILREVYHELRKHSRNSL